VQNIEKVDNVLFNIGIFTKLAQEITSSLLHFTNVTITVNMLRLQKLHVGQYVKQEHALSRKSVALESIRIQIKLKRKH
jgi:hypothetical protein